MQIIGEVKTESPYGFKSKYSWDELFTMAHAVSDIISVHTDPRWGGSFELLTRAREISKELGQEKLILAKGIHANDSDIVKAIEEYKADLVLVVGRIAGVHLDRCLIEPNTIAELQALPLDVKAVWNSRDLSDGGLKSETFDAARLAFDGWLCQASNITKLADINPKADAVLIGAHLPQVAQELGYNAGLL